MLQLQDRLTISLDAPCLAQMTDQASVIKRSLRSRRREIAAAKAAVVLSLFIDPENMLGRAQREGSTKQRHFLLYFYFFFDQFMSVLKLRYRYLSVV